MLAGGGPLEGQAPQGERRAGVTETPCRQTWPDVEYRRIDVAIHAALRSARRRAVPHGYDRGGRLRPPLMRQGRRQRQALEHPDRQPRDRQGSPRGARPPPSCRSSGVGRWVTLDRDRTNARGRFVLRKRLRGALSARARVRLSSRRDPLARPAERLPHAHSRRGTARACSATSWAAAARCTTGSLGVANKSLPCGTKVTLRHHGRVVRVPVIDRGPYVGGREYDLTAATARKLGFSGHGPIQVTQLGHERTCVRGRPYSRRGGSEARHRPPRLRRVLRHGRADPAP